jgi:hypothetical protein
MKAIACWLKAVPRFFAAQLGIPASMVERATFAVVFLGIYFYYGWLLDNPVWWYAVSEYGYLYGNFGMTSLAIIHNFALLYFFAYLFRKFGFDWLAQIMGELKGLASNMDYVKVSRAMSQWRTKIVFFFLVAAVKPLLFPTFVMALLLRGRVSSFLSLSIFADSFLTTAYLRQRDSVWLARGDLKIFILSSLVSCAYWSLRSSGVVAIAHFIFSIF